MPSDDDDSLMKDLDEMSSPLHESSLRYWDPTNLPGSPSSTAAATAASPGRKPQRLRKELLAAFQRPILPLSPNSELRLLIMKNQPNAPENDNFGNTAPLPPRIPRRAREKDHEVIHPPWRSTERYSRAVPSNHSTTIMDFRTGESMQSSLPTSRSREVSNRLAILDNARELSIFGSEDDGFVSTSSSEDSTSTSDYHRSDPRIVDEQDEDDSNDDDDTPTSSSLSDSRHRLNQSPMEYDKRPMSRHPQYPPWQASSSQSDPSYMNDSEDLTTTASSSVFEHLPLPSSETTGSSSHLGSVQYLPTISEETPTADKRIEQTRQALREAEQKRESLRISLSHDEPTLKDESEKRKRTTWPLYMGLMCFLLGVFVFITVYSVTREDRRSSNRSFPTNGSCQQALPVINMVGDTLRGEFFLDASRSSSVDCGDQSIDGNLLWYYIEGTDQRIQASTCSSTEVSSELDTQLSVFTGSCGDLKCVGTSGQLCGSHGSVGWFAELNKGYYIVVSSSGTSSSGRFALALDSPSENSSCDDATRVEHSHLPMPGSTRNLPIDSDAIETCFSNQGSIPTAWYQFVGTGSVMCIDVQTDPYLIPEVAMSFSVLRRGTDCRSLSCQGLGYTMYGWKKESRAVALETIAGNQYMISVGGVRNDSEGDFALKVFLPHSNAFCEAAEPLELGAEPFTGGNLTTACNIELPVCSGTLNRGGLWYSIQGTGEIFEVEFSGLSCWDESGPVSSVTIFRSNGEDCSDLECIDSRPRECSDGSTRVATQWFAEVSVTYMVLVQSTDPTRFEVSVRPLEGDEVDICQGASLLEIAGDTVVGSTSEAQTPDLGLCYSPGSPGVWFQVEGTGNSLKASTCHPDTNYSTAITIVSGVCSDPQCTPTQVTTCDGQQSMAYWDSVKGLSYYIYVHGRQVTDVGSFALTIEEDSLDATNDFCGSAQAVQVPSTVYGSTLQASDDSTYSSICGVLTTAPGVWYTVVGNGQFITASLCGSTTTYDTQLYLFAGENCRDLTCVTFNEDGCGLQSEITWKSEPDMQYFLLVSGFGVDVGEFEMRVI